MNERRDHDAHLPVKPDPLARIDERIATASSERELLVLAIIRREIAEQLEIERDGEHRRRIQNRDNLVNNVLKPFALVGGVILAVAGHAAAGVLAIGVALYQLAPALIEKFFARWLREQESGGPDDAPE